LQYDLDLGPGHLVHIICHRANLVLEADGIMGVETANEVVRFQITRSCSLKFMLRGMVVMQQ
jgi:hypothetical protein